VRYFDGSSLLAVSIDLRIPSKQVDENCRLWPTTLKEYSMSDLTPRETELVALGAALGSNCVPCVEYHIPQARKAGLTDPEIHAAIQLADKVRQVPARKVMDTALNLLPHGSGRAASSAPGDSGCGCGIAGKAQPIEPASADRTMNTMSSMMSKMMSACAAAAGGCSVPAKDASNE
jgi:AhpD family alkylhydroperoxidase